MIHTNKILLVVGGLLIVCGLYSKLTPNFKPAPNNPNADVMDLTEPSDPSVKKEALEVAEIFRKAGNSSKNDARKLRDLYLDLAKLISLDGNDLVIKNTEEIRQANSIAGTMFRLDIKNKYDDLSKESQDVIIAAIGDDQINLSTELRAKAVEAFNSLAWACNIGSK